MNADSSDSTATPIYCYPPRSPLPTVRFLCEESGALASTMAGSDNCVPAGFCICVGKFDWLCRRLFHGVKPVHRGDLSELRAEGRFPEKAAGHKVQCRAVFMAAEAAESPLCRRDRARPGAVRDH